MMKGHLINCDDEELLHKIVFRSELEDTKKACLGCKHESVSYYIEKVSQKQSSFVVES